MFAPNQQIECIDEIPGTMLLKGIYTVASANNDFVYLKEIEGGWMAKRFTAVRFEPAFSLDEIS